MEQKWIMRIIFQDLKIGSIEFISVDSGMLIDDL
jgi:hypothetical protein